MAQGGRAVMGGSLPGLGSVALLSGDVRLSNCADQLVRAAPLSPAHAPRFGRCAHEQRADRSVPAAGDVHRRRCLFFLGMGGRDGRKGWDGTGGDISGNGAGKR